MICTSFPSVSFLETRLRLVYLVTSVLSCSAYSPYLLYISTLSPHVSNSTRYHVHIVPPTPEKYSVVSILLMKVLSLQLDTYLLTYELSIPSTRRIFYDLPWYPGKVSYKPPWICTFLPPAFPGYPHITCVWAHFPGSTGYPSP